jgi:hypothetical protein
MKRAPTPPTFANGSALPPAPAAPSPAPGWGATAPAPPAPCVNQGGPVTLKPASSTPPAAVLIALACSAAFCALGAGALVLSVLLLALPSGCRS